jgi:hypothetical protein
MSFTKDSRIIGILMMIFLKKALLMPILNPK